MNSTFPGGRWRYLMGGALVAIGFLSQRVVTTVLTMFEDFGLDVPLRIRVAASPLWVGGWLALAVMSICTAAALGRRRDAQAFVLASATLLLLGASAFTFLAALLTSFGPFQSFIGCGGTIR